MGRLSDAINQQGHRGGSRIGSSGGRIHRRRSPGRIVLGHDVLDATLKDFNVAAANRIARSGLGKSVRVVSKAIKAQVPSGMKGVRGAIGYRVGSGKGRGRSSGVTHAKAGTVHTRATKTAGTKTAKVMGKKTRFRSARRRPGVGISWNNIHWWIMGTGPRVQKTTGRSTGVMPPQKPIVKAGYAASSAAAITALRDGVIEGIQRELTKKHKKK